MRDDPTVVALVVRARAGDRTAWDEIVERYKGLVWRICRRLGLQEPDALDVAQSVWLRLLEHLDTLRVPAALPGWLETTTRNEGLALLRRQHRELPETASLEQATRADAALIEEDLLLEEQRVALRVAFAALDPASRQLLLLLMQVPPLSYAEVGERLGVKIGSLGPRRGRCLDKIRQHPTVAALIEAARAPDRGDDHDRTMVGR
jgi:RNA polymerase sigma factor (sigma-70 family)